MSVKDLAGRVALVTGGGSGIGRATAVALAEAGATVVVADIDEAAGRETVALLEGAGGRAAFVCTDVTRWEDLGGMVAFAEETFGGLHIVHNNAGINTGWPPFPRATREAWSKTIAVNLWAVIAVIQAALPAMVHSGGGVIVNTASLAGLVTYVGDPIYAATKHGVVGLTRALVSLKGEANVRVNCVCPGFVDTPLPRRRLDEMPDDERARWEALLAQIPMITPAEVADGVLELVRDESLTGEVMAIVYGEPRRLVPPAMKLL